jgi:hypothetical protein
VAAKMFFDGRHALIVLGIRVALSPLLAILAALVLIVAVIALFIQLLWLAEIRLQRFEGQAAQYHQLLEDACELSLRQAIAHRVEVRCAVNHE